VAIALLGRNWAPKRRSFAAVVATTVFVVSSLLLSRAVYARAAESLGADNARQLLDISLSPRAAQLACWNAVTVERNDPANQYVLRRGTISLAPFIGCRSSGVTWSEGTTQSLPLLRDVVQRDCWVRQWMQFARTPAIFGDTIVDYR